MFQGLGEATQGIWWLSDLGANPWWRLLTVPAAIIGITAVWFLALGFMATIGLVMVGCYIIAAIVLLLLPGRVFRLRRLF
jgi:hypothetical protein